MSKSYSKISKKRRKKDSVPICATKEYRDFPLYNGWFRSNIIKFFAILPLILRIEVRHKVSFRNKLHHSFLRFSSHWTSWHNNEKLTTLWKIFRRKKSVRRKISFFFFFEEKLFVLSYTRYLLSLNFFLYTFFCCKMKNKRLARKLRKAKKNEDYFEGRKKKKKIFF